MKDIDRAWTESRAIKWFYDSDAVMVYYVSIILGLPVALPLTVPNYFNGWFMPTLVSVLIFSFFFFTPMLPPALNPTNKIDNTRYHADGTPHNCSTGRGYSFGGRHCPGDVCEGSLDLVKQVRALPREDQVQFPYDLIQTLLRDIETTQRYKINVHVKATLNEIEARNKQRELAQQRAIPTDHIIDALRDARSNFKIETDTLKELT